jgi:hypothetical protein
VNENLFMKMDDFGAKMFVCCACRWVGSKKKEHGKYFP